MDSIVVEAILVTGIGGVSVRAITGWLKKKLAVKKGFMIYLVSLAVCAVATALYLLPTGFVWAEFAVYTAFVFLGANTAYRVSKRTT